MGHRAIGSKAQAVPLVGLSARVLGQFRNHRHVTSVAGDDTEDGNVKACASCVPHDEQRERDGVQVHVRERDEHDAGGDARESHSGLAQQRQTAGDVEGSVHLETRADASR